MSFWKVYTADLGARKVEFISRKIKEGDSIVLAKQMSPDGRTLSSLVLTAIGKDSGQVEGFIETLSIDGNTGKNLVEQYTVGSDYSQEVPSGCLPLFIVPIDCAIVWKED